VHFKNPFNPIIMLQGEDFILTLTVKDSTDTLVDLTAIDVLQVKAHLFVGYTQVAIYALTVEQGFLPMTLDGANKIVLPVTRKQSCKFPTGTLSCMVAVAREDMAFADDKVTKYSIKNIGELLQDNSIPIL
jgi:hypothetical protein